MLSQDVIQLQYKNHDFRQMSLLETTISVLNKSNVGNLITFNKINDSVLLSPKDNKSLSVIYNSEFYLSDIGYAFNSYSEWDIETLTANLKKHKKMMAYAKSISKHFFSGERETSHQDCVSFTQNIHHLVTLYGGGACGEFVQFAFYELLKSDLIDSELPLFFYAVQMEVMITIHKPNEGRHIRTPMQHTIGLIDRNRIDFEDIENLHDLKPSEDCVVIDPWNKCEVLTFSNLNQSVLLDLKSWKIDKITHRFVVKPDQLKRIF